MVTHLLFILTGKSSSLLIALVVIYFNIHLLWLYGSIQTDTSTYSPPVTYHAMNEHTLVINSSLIEIASNEIDLNRYGHIVIHITQPVCKLLNVSNRLPIYVMTFSLSLILLLNSLVFVFACVLIQKTRQLRGSEYMNQMIFDSRMSLVDCPVDRLKISNVINFKRDDYTLVKCIISLSIFSVIFNTPSLIIRNFLMLGITFNSYQVETPGRCWPFLCLTGDVN